MSDARLIDANALIRTACVKFYTTNYYSHILEMIDNAPTIEPKQEWIPCEERLPEENGFYLVTADHWHDKAFRSTDLYSFIDGKWYTVHDDIIAWMPLPEPWNGEISE